MTLKSIVLSLSLLLSIHKAYTQESPEAYVTSALDIMKKNAVNRATLELACYV